MESIGLITFTPFSTYSTANIATEFTASYQGTSYLLKRDDAMPLDLGHAFFTAVGGELLRICTPKRDDAYCEATLNFWKHVGWNIG